MLSFQVQIRNFKLIRNNSCLLLAFNGDFDIAQVAANIHDAYGEDSIEYFYVSEWFGAADRVLWTWATLPDPKDQPTLLQSSDFSQRLL